MYFLYSCLSFALFVLVSPYFAYQALRYNKYVGSLSQRLGYLPVSFTLDGARSIWIHAVSVGEVLTARALVRELRDRYPSLKLFVSTTTMTGQRVARSALQGVDSVFFFPFDFGFIVRRTLRLVRPRLFVMMEPPRSGRTCCGPVLYVRIGAAFNLPPVERRQRDADLQRNTDEIMCRIAVLLPARYLGFYANHPRLVELYAGQPANAEPAAVNL